MSMAWAFYISTVLVYLGVNMMACWGLNLQYGYTGILNFATSSSCRPAPTPPRS